DKFQIFVTTHSPYILSSFNNLIYSGNINSKLNTEGKKTDKLNKIIPVKEQLRSDLFSVYSLRNNEQKYLIEEESKLISPTILDSVSDEISIEFRSEERRVGKECKYRWLMIHSKQKRTEESKS